MAEQPSLFQFDDIHLDEARRLQGVMMAATLDGPIASE